jgi:type IV secretion system protein VirB10
MNAQPAPDLDAGAPQLKASEGRRLNRQAIGLVVVLIILMALAVTWTFNTLIASGKDKPKPSEGRVTVPTAPNPPPPPQAPASQAQPIAVIKTPPPELPKPDERPRGPTLMERRMMDTNAVAAVGVNAATDPTMAIYQQQMAALGMQANMPMAGASAAEGAADMLPAMPAQFAMPGNSAYRAQPQVKTASAQPLRRPDEVMTRGTYIRCVLETHIVTDVPGFTSCIVTEPVYSFTGKRLLLPKGSKVLGKYDRESDTDRVAVVWDRVITPTGIDVNMASPGIDNLGGAGNPGYRDAHWGQRIGAALLISMLSDAFSYEAAKHGPQTTTIASGAVVQSPWQSNTAQTLQELAGQAVRRAANRPDTITINQGTVVYVYVARDIDFSGVLARF